MSEEQAKAEMLFGVSLDDLARIHAAERAGVPIEERLSELGLDRTAFSRAEQAWLTRLSTSLRDDPALFVAYDIALARAVASDAPKILPLEEDLGAWISFEGHFQRAANPGELAKSAGLSLQEVARLHAQWSAKLSTDPALAEQATKLRAEPPAPLPVIQRESRKSAPTRGQATAVPVPERKPAPALSPAPVPPPLAAPLPGSTGHSGAPAPRWDAGTMEIDLSTLDVRAVPFQSSALNDQSAVRTKEQAAVPETPSASSPKAPAGMGMTGDVPADLLKRIAQGPTPFAKAPPVPATAKTFSAMTTDVPVDLVARIAKGATPFDPREARPPLPTGGAPPPAQTAALTLEQHASLTAELQVFQDRAEAVFAKYGLTDARQRLATEQAFRERLRKNPDEEKEWRRLHQHYLAHWRGRAPHGDPAR